MPDQPESKPTIVGRARRASQSLMSVNPQLGMWQAAGTAIAQAPNLSELRDMDTGADNIAFNGQGHSVRLAAVEEDSGRLELTRVNTGFLGTNRRTSSATADRKRSEPAVITSAEVSPDAESSNPNEAKKHNHHHLHLHGWHKHKETETPRPKANWGPTIMNGLKAFWKFFKSPSGFLITIYFLNIVAWGAMLFFLLLKAAPAMNVPDADDDNSPRKVWLEIDSQILNALFCVTGFGLAPWRFRDLYWFIQGVHQHKRHAMSKLVAANKSWFRPPTWYEDGEGATDTESEKKAVTFTGQRAPPTPTWKLGFTIWMMIVNTLLQAILCFFMWHYNRIDRPGWATGTFIGLGCGSAMMAGLMSYWESRKVKKIEGPAVEIV